MNQAVLHFLAHSGSYLGLPQREIEALMSKLLNWESAGMQPKPAAPAHGDDVALARAERAVRPGTFPHEEPLN